MIYLAANLLLVIPLVLLARYARVYPHRTLMALVIVGALFSAALCYRGAVARELDEEQTFLSLFTQWQAYPLWTQIAFWTVLGYDALVLIAAGIDLVLLFARHRAASFTVEREMGRSASLNKPHGVSLCIINHTPRTWLAAVKDDVPHELRPEPEDFYLKLPPRSRTTMQYQMKSERRGAFTLECVYVKVLSLLHLWKRYYTYKLFGDLHVYPDMKQISEYAVLARKNRLNLLGVRRTRKIGQDNEFERLRDYTLDDTYKHIEWRTTARRQKLTVKDFQDNQSQTLMFLLDCGRMMTNQSGGLSLLDHALNSMLMLSYVALSKGDSVGLITFSDEIHGFVPPKSGSSQMNRLLHASFDRFPHLVESRYDQAFLYLKNKVRKRSLVILITNVIDEVNAQQVHQYLCNLVGRHLPLGVLLRDHRLFQAVEVAHPHGDALYRAAAAADILTWRRQVLVDMNSRGVLSVDAFPEELTAPLINSYLEIKARHLL